MHPATNGSRGKKHGKKTAKQLVIEKNTQSYQVLVQSKESHLAWTVQQISEACESIINIHV